MKLAKKKKPFHIDTKLDLPDHIRAKVRPVCEALYKDAKTKFYKIVSYFYEHSNSTVASLLVIAPKATEHLSAFVGTTDP